MAVNDHLLREKAPIPELAWKAVDDEARERLTPLLSGRRLADWTGTTGWQTSSVDLGRSRRLDGPPPGVKAEGTTARLRRVQAMAEFRVPFSVSRDEIDDLQRGAQDPEFDDLARAAREAAVIENRAIFHGWPEAGFEGIAGVSPYEAHSLGDNPDSYPATVARAVDHLRRNGIEGPYALAIAPEGYTRIVETAEHGGYPLFEHLSRILGGQILRAHGLDGAVVVSQRGGDFLLDVGQDLAIGYSDHDANEVHLYLEESFTFRAVEPDASVCLR
ncbi:family 1 encapsulin nanocompartment shell protein [Pseudonocardia sp. KRD291]|uniref:family 1 encapsulin nanocompartment shell protein n=1 Tax=Pseudonocardia sp. KRD291 TaxID=2792007 RepID=UPI001C4A3795|nr:family 1 encapsulin nanocompartment shell protein [Pseudonocardia sp. KRD291]MBW0106756.1 bacteriocin family protein [Pseudonocardia sp. KRD291]